MNVMDSGMEIIDEFYSNLNDGEIQSRIGSLGKQTASSNDNAMLIKEFLEWRKRQKT